LDLDSHQHMTTLTKKTVEIGGQTIGAGRTFLIADVGSNHNQDIKLALETIDAAVDSGADAVKFQSLQMKELYLDPTQDVKNLYAQIDLDESWYFELKSHCDKRNVTFFSSPTYMGAVDLMERLNVSVYKLASAQIGTYPQIVDRVARTGKPVILSTGLVSMGELESSIRQFDAAKNKEYIILHCNSIYPAPCERVNLPLMQTYGSLYGCPVGYSDHTIGIHIAMAAVAMGASVIEKHFALNLNLNTPDIVVALDPKGFSCLTRGIREIEKALIPQMRLSIEPEEQEFKDSLIYRMVLANSKKKGDSFNFNDFVFLRHNDGVDCRNLEIIIQYFCAEKSITSGALLNWNMVTGK
jgi:sialic acid synthase SpsE